MQTTHTHTHTQYTRLNTHTRASVDMRSRRGESPKHAQHTRVCALLCVTEAAVSDRCVIHPPCRAVVSVDDDDRAEKRVCVRGGELMMHCYWAVVGNVHKDAPHRHRPPFTASHYAFFLSLSLTSEGLLFSSLALPPSPPSCSQRMRQCEY